VAIQMSNLAERLLCRVEALIETQLNPGADGQAIDRRRCPFCNAIVPEIRPVAFEYCPYCEATLDSFLTDERQQSTSSFSRLLGSWLPVDRRLQPARATVTRGWHWRSEP